MTDFQQRKERNPTCFGLSPNTGSETLLLCLILLVLLLDNSVMVSTDADGTKEAMAIVDWLFDTLGAIEYDVSLSFTFPGGNGGRGAAGAPIMR